MERLTKIVATIGPASRNPDEILARMVEAGMDVARMNFSHGKPTSTRTPARLVRDAAGRAGASAILPDLPGPSCGSASCPTTSPRSKPGDQTTFGFGPNGGQGHAPGCSSPSRAGDDRHGPRDHVPRRRRHPAGRLQPEDGEIDPVVEVGGRWPRARD